MKRILAFVLVLALVPLCGMARVYTDSAGRPVELGEKVERVAVTGAMAQMLVFAIAPDRMVGLATRWDDSAGGLLEDKYLELPLLGQLYGGKGDLNLEQLLLADPDLVIDVGEPKEGIREDMDDLQARTGIPFVHIDLSAQDMGNAFIELGTLLGLEDEGGKLAAHCQRVYGLCAGLAASSERPRAVYLLGDKGLNTLARGSYHAGLLDVMFENAAVLPDPSGKGTGDPIDLEMLYRWDPEVILFAPSVYEEVGELAEWQPLSAIRAGRYYRAPIGPYNWMGQPPSVQRLMGMLWMGEVLYPGQEAYDLYEEIAAFFRLFWHCELSRETFEELVGCTAA